MFRRFDLTPLRLLWLGLALLGGGLGLWRGVSLDASQGVALVVLALWCLIETTIRRNWTALLTFPAMALGIGCALPLYLFLRSRRIV
ncbi:DUF2834 domain-containing protein [Paracoccus aminophilus]|uniref:DUF2834 domain-containing protein n=1 Tax=Paracoccus aminophilus TaxID=34003 RepID=UPI0004195A94|nr:DUF2834 domain-containing protein [Paracoccus aminophilus]